MNLFETDPGENFFSFDSEKEGRRGREGLMERKRMEEDGGGRKNSCQKFGPT